MMKVLLRSQERGNAQSFIPAVVIFINHALGLELTDYPDPRVNHFIEALGNRKDEGVWKA